MRVVNEQQYLSREEEQSLAVKGVAGDADARNTIIMGLYPMFWREAKRIHHRNGYSMEDLVQAAIVHCLKRFHNFDPLAGFRASTYFLPVAKREMQRVVTQSLIKTTVTGEVTDRCLDDAKKARCVKSLHQTIRGKRGEDRELLDGVADESIGRPIEEAAKNEEIGRLREAINSLESRSRRIVEMRMDGKKLQEIGREYGLTKERVRQIEAIAHAEIKAFMEGDQSQPRSSKPQGTCAHCRREGMVLAARGLCYTCYRDLETRDMFKPGIPGSKPKHQSRTCHYCKHEFKPNNADQAFCSRKCAARGKSASNPNSIFFKGSVAMNGTANKNDESASPTAAPAASPPLVAAEPSVPLRADSPLSFGVLADIEREIAETEARLDELRIAAKVLRRMQLAST